MNSTVGAVIFLAFVALSAALPTDTIGVVGAGECPQVKSQDTMNMKSFLGDWYEYERFPNIFEPGFDCVKASYTPLEPGTVLITNEGFISIKIGGQVVFHEKFTAYANATVCDPKRPAELCVRFSSLQPPVNRTNYQVIDTDYENYVMIYSCHQAFGSNIQYAWILSRRPGVGPSNIDALKKKLTDAGVDVSNFIPVKQTNC